MHRIIAPFILIVAVSGTLTMPGEPVAAQDAVLEKLYGAGVHSYYAGDYRRAIDYFSKAINAGTKDPRPYYFRGLALDRLGRPEDAQLDFEQGAQLEMSDINQFYPVAASLARVQGGSRVSIEQHRTDARLASYEQAVANQKVRFGQGADGEPLPAPAPVDPTPITDPADGELFPQEPEPNDGGAGIVDPFKEPVDTFDPPATVPDRAPVDPTDPPVDPVGPAPVDPPPVDPFGNPAEPADPGEPTDPFGNPAEPTDPAEPADPFGNPAEPADPADPFGNPTDPPAPVDPPGPTDPAPVDPFDPGADPGAGAAEPAGDIDAGKVTGGIGRAFLKGIFGGGGAEAEATPPAPGPGPAAPTDPFADDPEQPAKPADPPAADPFDPFGNPAPAPADAAPVDPPAPADPFGGDAAPAPADPPAEPDPFDPFG